MNWLFLSGCEYYTGIIRKEAIQRTWYEKLYVLYYENFKTLLLILACIVLYKFINIQYTCNKQNQIMTGGFDVISGIAEQQRTVRKSTMLSKTTKNMEKTKSFITAPFKGESYKKLGSSIKSGVSSGYQRSKELGSAGLEYGKEGIVYGAEQFREKSEFIYKYIALLFIGIGFSVYIFPVLAMFLIGALTFLIVRKNIANVITM